MQKERESPEHNDSNAGTITRLVRWFDSRLGLSYPFLRSVPAYSINPFYWLGALTVVAFVIQGITGVIMMLYYIPDPTTAYSSTQYIFQNVSYGRFLETVHLYTAYAMIMLAFMHMIRGYFVSVQKKPRELMWIIGMGMGFVTLGFGFTGYLLPWTVVSKSATDVGIGMINALPPPVSGLISFLIVGAGGDATELLRFYDLHVVILPAVLLALLALKMYMLEANGISEPVTGGELTPKQKRLIPIFPDISLYLLELAAIFGSGMLLISAAFPLNLPVQFSPQAAAQTAPQPDWYFLWIYQILKISVFEGKALPVALTIVTLVFIVLILLPFLDRSSKKRISDRPVYITLGIIFVAEIVALTYWGLITPGQIIPVEQAALVLGSLALVIAVVSLGLFRVLTSRAKTRLHTVSAPKLRSAEIWNGIAFTAVASFGALTMGTSIDGSTRLILGGVNFSNLSYLTISLVGLAICVLGTMYLIYRSDLGTGLIRRRVKAFEIGWREQES
jgi:quinol-cytochrome oxidoreductase complex cytochrome b subunit